MPVRFRTSAMAAPRLNPVTRNFVVPSLGVYAARALSPHVWAENGRLSARGLGARGVPPRRRCGHKGGNRDGRTLSLQKTRLVVWPPPPSTLGVPSSIPRQCVLPTRGATRGAVLPTRADTFWRPPFSPSPPPFWTSFHAPSARSPTPAPPFTSRPRAMLLGLRPTNQRHRSAAQQVSRESRGDGGGGCPLPPWPFGRVRGGMTRQGSAAQVRFRDAGCRAEGRLGPHGPGRGPWI